jgi:hypothetical protein
MSLIERNYREFHHSSVRDWFEEMGVVLLKKVRGDEVANEVWLKAVGVIEPRDQLIRCSCITGNYLSGNKNYGDGWFRGGAESFYKIMEMTIRSSGRLDKRQVAFKAINTLGDIEEKVLNEAARMAVISGFDGCGKVYAVGEGVIVKEFLIEDEFNLAQELVDREKIALIDLLGQFKLRPLAGRVEYVQSGGRVMLTDLGSGDILGPELLTFLRMNS